MIDILQKSAILFRRAESRQERLLRCFRTTVVSEFHNKNKKMNFLSFLSSTVKQHDKLLESMKNIKKFSLSSLYFRCRVWIYALLICLPESIVLEKNFTQKACHICTVLANLPSEDTKTCCGSKSLHKTTGVLSDVVLKIVWNHRLGCFLMELTFVL